MQTDRPTIYILDDDLRIREALSDLLCASGYTAIAFETAQDYLSFEKVNAESCLILDMDMPGMTGLELQKEISGTAGPPIIFLTGHGDVQSSVKAMKAGALEFLLKPFDEADLLRALEAALQQDRADRTRRNELENLKRRYALLSPREREVLPLVVSGLLNKQTAGELGKSEITIRVQRGQIMKKMGAQSLADLVRMTAKLGIE
ncbi:response regulator transcription factor [Granulicella sp. WH15]|uniref:response regulator transcription factor n=1 Tax=Granulicella sp. WH15 TaxID=2602070 RepID=UPI00136726DB|nr:response regulator [Granulicella sp. WH15]QHN03636.1 response regulator transcription factor [Granulicella sp. WH15]